MVYECEGDQAGFTILNWANREVFIEKSVFEQTLSATYMNNETTVNFRRKRGKECGSLSKCAKYANYLL